MSGGATGSGSAVMEEAAAMDMASDGGAGEGGDTSSSGGLEGQP